MVYANYGRQQDFYWLKSSGVSVVGSLVVVRVGGGVSFAEKVWLAEKNGAGGVLIYPDPADLPQDPRRLGLNTHTAVSEHVTHTHTSPPSSCSWPTAVSCLQVHLGSGDPFTPGFPSFNHTQFPSIQSSGLPLIPALPVSATVAAKLLRYVQHPQVELRWRWDPLTSVCLSQLTGPSCPPLWRVRLPYVQCVVGPDLSSGRKVKMSVTNQMTPVLLNNIFSSLEGRLEPGTEVQPHPGWSLRDPGLSVRPVHHPGGPEGLAGSRSRQVWSRDGCPAGAGSDLLCHGQKW